MANDAAKLAVWGDPIAHSRSPQLHSAAYAVLGLPWTYQRQRVGAEDFPDALAALDSSWRGLSLTMPLKAVARDAAVRVDARAQLTGAVNTLLLAENGPIGYNTDVGGIIGALAGAGVDQLSRARLIGAGATASSALVALAEMGASTVEVSARRPEAIAALADLGDRAGVQVISIGWDAAPRDDVPVTISTLPGNATVSANIAATLAQSGGLLMDAVYGQWPTTLGYSWFAAKKQAISGLGMLLHQALLQVRVFVAGSADQPLDRESEVLTAMREQLVSEPAL